MSKTSTSTPVWRLRAQADKRFRSGHPWVYSNELQESPKGIEPGTPVELQDAGGKFLARGYGNPHSLIAFRSLSRDPANAAPHQAGSILLALTRALKARLALGLGDASFRLCYGEADELPGLVIDRYRTGATAKAQDTAQTLVVQMHTAGMDLLLGPSLLEVLRELVEAWPGGVNWEKTAVVLRNDLSVRKLEGVPVEEPRVLKEVASLDLRNAKIWLAAAKPGTLDSVSFAVDLVEGQKTGFFLDQTANVQLAAMRLGQIKPAKGGKLRILDICCYVGQWSTQLAHHFKAAGVEVEIVAADASAAALDRARGNVEKQGARFEGLKIDVLEGLAKLPDQSFDLIVCDPPALIKNRKDLPTGTHAYLQLNTQVFRLIRRGGAVVSCSCSGLLEEEEFIKVLSKASYRNRVPVRWIARGSQAPDHPVRLEFPEGRYLKCWIGLTEA